MASDQQQQLAYNGDDHGGAFCMREEGCTLYAGHPTPCIDGTGSSPEVRAAKRITAALMVGHHERVDRMMQGE